MHDWMDQINKIDDMDKFLTFLVDLAMDAKDNPDEWANTNITDYLGQMAGWIDDWSDTHEDIDWESMDYKSFAKILYMGKLYE